MMAKFKELLRKRAKEGKFLNDEDKSVKGELLDAIGSIMSEKSMNDLKGLKKVTVASDSKEGLKEGLEKAKEAVESKEEESEDEEEGEEEESEEESENPMCEMSKEEKIAQLEKQLAMLKSE